MTESRQDAWERRTAWPLTLAAALFLAAYAWPILAPGLAPQLRHLCRAVTVLTWLAFAADYAVRLLLSRHRLVFVRQHLLDLLIVVLPIFRPLQLLRLVTLLRFLDRRAGSAMRGRVAVYVAVASTLVIFVSSLAVLSVERRAPDANITSFGSAVWWAVTTVTTVGYGDVYPVTVTGRVVAGLLMLAGIALIGVVTASFASWLISRVAEVQQDAQAATRGDVSALARQVEALREEVARLKG